MSDSPIRLADGMDDRLQQVAAKAVADTLGLFSHQGIVPPTIMAPVAYSADLLLQAVFNEVVAAPALGVLVALQCVAHAVGSQLAGLPMALGDQLTTALFWDTVSVRDELRPKLCPDFDPQPPQGNPHG